MSASFAGSATKPWMTVGDHFYGTLIRRKMEEGATFSNVPGLLFFHTGAGDPFVAEEALDNSIATFSRHGHAVEVLQNKT